MHPGDSSSGPAPIDEIWPKGTVVKDDYVIDARIGKGGFGVAYKATHQILGSTHAIKRLHDKYSADPEFVRKFTKEAVTVRRLKGCPYVVEVEHMTRTHDGRLVMIMEYVDGGSLKDLLDSGPRPVQEVIEAGRQIALGLDAAHRVGLVHRDIKPHNVLIGRDHRNNPLLKLIDFGLVADHTSQESTSLMVGGSLGYTAPEQWLFAGKHIDGRADLYSLGVSLYQMLCGRMPFPIPEGTTALSWMLEVRKGPPTPPLQFRPDCPLELSALIMELLALEPPGRPESAAVVAQRFEAMTGARPKAAEPPRVQPPPVQPPRAKTIVEQPVVVKKRTSPWAVGAVAGILMIGAVGWVVTQDRKVPEPAKKEESKKEEPIKPINVPVVDPPKPIVEKKPDPPPPVEVKRKKEKPPEPKPEPPVDHAALGDAARNQGDMKGALAHYRALKDKQRLAALQRAIEGEVDERASALRDSGKYPEALRVVDEWLPEFRDSQRLLRLRALIVRARDQ